MKELELEQKDAHEGARPLKRGLNRWSVGSLSVMQLVLMSIIFMSINLIGFSDYRRWDMSQTEDYSLSPMTKNYLASDALKTRQQAIKWILVFRRSSPLYERTRAIVEEYANRSQGKIELEMVDAMREPERTQQVMEAYQLKLVEDVLIMDARQKDEPAVLVDAQGMKSLHAHVKIAAAEDMLVYRADEYNQRKVVAYQGEDLLTANLVAAIEGKAKKMLFFADKSQIDAQDENAPWQAITRLLQFKNIQLIPVNLAGLKSIPEDVDGVAFISPKYELSSDEMNVIQEYWKRPKAAILALLKPGDVPSNLRMFLRSYGVTPRNDLLMLQEDQRLTTSVRGHFVPGIEFLKGLAGQSTAFEGLSSSLELREGDEELLASKVRVLPLVQAEKGFWGETKFGDGKETFTPEEDIAAPLYLAAAVSRGSEISDEFRQQSSRMVVISNDAFLKEENRRMENIDFLATGCNWLLNREALAGIGSRTLGLYKIPLKSAHIDFLNQVNIIFFPALFGVMAIWIWSVRRA